MNEPTLYIMCGLPFSGKTTLARGLEQRNGWVRIAIDEINRERGVWDDESGMSENEWAATYAEAYRRTTAALNQGLSVIDDSVNYTRELRDRLRAVAEGQGASSIVIFVDVPVAEAQRRWLENRRSGGRQDVRDEDFNLVAGQFESPTPDEDVILYDGTIPVDLWCERTFGRQTR